MFIQKIELEISVGKAKVEPNAVYVMHADMEVQAMDIATFALFTQLYRVIVMLHAKLSTETKQRQVL